jgi:hypothetical protein
LLLIIFGEVQIGEGIRGKIALASQYEKSWKPKISWKCCLAK